MKMVPVTIVHAALAMSLKLCESCAAKQSAAVFEVWSESMAPIGRCYGCGEEPATLTLIPVGMKEAIVE